LREKLTGGFEHVGKEIMDKPLIFISYSHDDKGWMNKFKIHLSVLYYQELCETWSDVQIQAGQDWEKLLIEKINLAKIAVLLISPDFLASEFINVKEIPLFIERKNDGLQIIPIMIRPCSWKHVEWLADLQIRPDPNNPLSQLGKSKIDSELAKIVDEIGDILKCIGIEVESSVKDKIIREPYHPAPRDNVRTKASIILTE
jgi:hypothetical protein